MDRRTFLTLTAVSLVVPYAARAKALSYTPGLVKERLAKGETLFSTLPPAGARHAARKRARSKR